MSFLDSVKRLLGNPDLPSDTRSAFERAQSYRDLLIGLDRVCTSNEVKLREIEREIHKLEAVERSEVERLREPEVTDRQKKLILQRISRLRTQIQILDDKIDIHTKNIELHQTLMGKIQRIESMSMQAVDEALIQEVLTDFEEQFESYKNVLHTGEAAAEVSTSPLSTRDRVELRRLEEELLGPRTERAAQADKQVARVETEREARVGEAPAKQAEAPAKQAEPGATEPQRAAERQQAEPELE